MIIRDSEECCPCGGPGPLLSSSGVALVPLFPSVPCQALWVPLPPASVCLPGVNLDDEVVLHLAEPQRDLPGGGAPTGHFNPGEGYSTWYS